MDNIHKFIDNIFRIDSYTFNDIYYMYSLLQLFVC